MPAAATCCLEKKSIRLNPCQHPPPPVLQIRASGCNVLLIQKSILRDAVTDLSLHYLVRHAFADCSQLQLLASRTLFFC